MKAQLAYLASVQESAFWEGIALNGLEELRLRLRGLMRVAPTFMLKYNIRKQTKARSRTYWP